MENLANGADVTALEIIEDDVGDTLTLVVEEFDSSVKAWRTSTTFRAASASLARFSFKSWIILGLTTRICAQIQ